MDQGRSQTVPKGSQVVTKAAPKGPLGPQGFLKGAQKGPQQKVLENKDPLKNGFQNRDRLKPQNSIPVQAGTLPRKPVLASEREARYKTNNCPKHTHTHNI